ncbi:MAG: response regulator [Candidatus Eremiobacteraeota bacterium]|nr:response regulator [Candidatus Eremiobacteraeota bacterium]MCW5867539.1 response regulator [Candidatus Eremiobacteraeota bacterium]
MRILLVDDDAFSRKLMGFYLKPMGIEVELVSSGEECLTSVAVQAPDLILMDCQMPGMDGFETTRRLRAEHYAGVILALTGNSDEDTLRNCSESGMNGHMSKPVDAGVLRARIAAALPHLQVEAPPPLEAPPAEDPLARARKIADAARNPAILGRLVGSFLKSADETVGMLETALQSQDGSAVAAAAHRLRGSSGSFGATALSEAAGKLEDALQSQNLNECAPLIAGVKELWPPLREHLVKNSGGTEP